MAKVSLGGSRIRTDAHRDRACFTRDGSLCRLSPEIQRRSTLTRTCSQYVIPRTNRPISSVSAGMSPDPTTNPPQHKCPNWPSCIGQPNLPPENWLKTSMSGGAGTSSYSAKLLQRPRPRCDPACISILTPAARSVASPNRASAYPTTSRPPPWKFALPHLGHDASSFSPSRQGPHVLHTPVISTSLAFCALLSSDPFSWHPPGVHLQGPVSARFYYQ